MPFTGGKIFDNLSLLLELPGDGRAWVENSPIEGVGTPEVKLYRCFPRAPTEQWQQLDRSTTNVTLHTHTRVRGDATAKKLQAKHLPTALCPHRSSLLLRELAAVDAAHNRPPAALGSATPELTLTGTVQSNRS